MLTAKSHFFVNPKSIVQNANQAFGPVNGDEANKYRVASLFTIQNDELAYAICKGVVLIQPQTGNMDKVNLILKPFEQPIKGLDIKYFVYRGLKKSDFFTNDDKIVESNEDASELIKKINETFMSFYSDESSIPDFESKFIGYSPLLLNSVSLSSLFFKTSNYIMVDDVEVESEDSAYDLPLIEAGKSIGRFAAGSCGIDVVLDYGDYELIDKSSEFDFNLEYARSVDVVIDITETTDTYQKKLMKEQVVQFIDVAAFYGMHHSENGVVNLVNLRKETPLKTDEIYKQLLNNFYTKNNWYVFIQSDRNRSYNFYGNYNIDGSGANDIFKGVTERNLIEGVYGTHGWPIIIENSPQIHDGTMNTLCFQLVSENNPNSVLYGQIVGFENDQIYNFYNSKSLNNTNIEIRKTNSILLSIPCFDNGSKSNVSHFSRLIYNGNGYQCLSAESEYVNVSFLDEKFRQIDSSSVLKGVAESAFSTICYKKINLNSQINFNAQSVSSYQSVKVFDKVDLISRITYLTKALEVLSFPVMAQGNVNTLSTNYSTQTESLTVSQNLDDLNLNFKLMPFYIGDRAIVGIYIEYANSFPNFYCLGLSQNENQNVLDVIQSSELTNSSFYFVAETDNSDFISSENIAYRVFKLAVIGESVEGELNMVKIEPEVLIYTIDERIYFSEDYSKYLKIEFPSLNYTISKTI